MRLCETIKNGGRGNTYAVCKQAEITESKKYSEIRAVLIITSGVKAEWRRMLNVSA